MKSKFNKKYLLLAILSMLLSAANGNAGETDKVSIGSAVESESKKAPTTQLVSVNLAGTDSGNDRSFITALSANGRFAVFDSFASDLVANDTNGTWDTFVRDFKTGTTTLVSVNSAGKNSGNSQSFGAALSANGRFAVFNSNASDLVANDTNDTFDTFVRDLKTGTTTLVSVNSAGTASGNRGAGSELAVISANGQFVAFTSSATDLVANDTNNLPDGFVRDLKTGTTTLVNVGIARPRPRPEIFRLTPALSANGQFAAFTSRASDLVANDTNSQPDVFVRDLKTGTITLVSINSEGTASGFGLSANPVLSADGRFVAFASGANDLVVNDTNGTQDIFVRDLKTGTTTLVSVNSAGVGSGNSFSFEPVFSTNGRFVAFTSFASDLVANDTNGGIKDGFVRDLKTGTTILVNVGKLTNTRDFFSLTPVLSANGRFAAFISRASDLVANDTNDLPDIFVRDLKTGTTMLASVNRAGTTSDNGQLPTISLSANGRFVAFSSEASDLVANDTNNASDVFVRPTR